MVDMLIICPSCGRRHPISPWLTPFTLQAECICGHLITLGAVQRVEGSEQATGASTFGPNETITDEPAQPPRPGGRPRSASIEPLPALGAGSWSVGGELESSGCR